MYGKVCEISKMIGCTFVNIENKDNIELYFYLKNGDYFIMLHQQDCCEQVSIEDINGDLQDLIGSPILKAEESRSNGDGKYGDSETWTFYHLATKKGYVTLRWYGTSNGYYSEDVDLCFISQKE